MSRPAVTAFVALGANLGDAASAVRTAMADIDRIPLTRVTARSSLYRSAPVDAQGPDFINAVVQVDTCLSAPQLLAHLQALELAAGRERPFLHAPRTLDLDLLTYGAARIESATLVVPHPRMEQRAFVLLPLAQIAPGRVSAVQLAAVAAQPIDRLAD